MVVMGFIYNNSISATNRISFATLHRYSIKLFSPSGHFNILSRHIDRRGILVYSDEFLLTDDKR